MFKIGVCGLRNCWQKLLVSHFIKYQDLISKNCGQEIAISIIADRSIDKKKINQ